MREGRLWGLIAAHHYSPRNLRHGVRTTEDLAARVSDALMHEAAAWLGVLEPEPE